MNPTRLDPRAERGFSMFLVIMAMAVTALFVAAGFAAANGDLPVSGVAKDRKAAYAAAEAGLNFYVNHLLQDNDYWTQCNLAPAPNSTEKSPINQQWDGTGDHDPREWRKVPSTNAQYTIELLHTTKVATCDPSKQTSLIDDKTGTFKLRITGRTSTDEKVKRSIVATFRRDSFLNFVYFTNYEDLDPQALSTSTARQTAQTNCADKYRSARKSCTEIQFPTGDAINGPLHTNDENLLLCGAPVFGRTSTMSDSLEVAGPAPATKPNGSNCGNNPTVNNTVGFTTNAKHLEMPTTNQSLAAVAQNGGRYYTGKTIIRLNGDKMDVTNYAPNGTATTQFNVAWPVNGVLYVANNGACTGEFPTDADYDDPVACGDVYLSGTYGQPLTIAAANDVIVKPTAGAKLANNSNDADIERIDGSDATLGLIANNFVRVAHRVNRSSSTDCNYSSTSEPVVKTVRIDAAILSLLHSFIVDNYDCGKLGTLTVNGAIAQKYRGPVGTSGGTSGTGFTKDYWYDDRFRYRSPPYFLSPENAAWDVVRLTEQVPAR